MEGLNTFFYYASAIGTAGTVCFLVCLYLLKKSTERNREANQNLCGMNEGIFPSRKVRTRAAMEEERRLAFVAVTRAQRELYLTESAGRNLDGTPRYPSRFLLDIDQNLLEYAVPPQEGLIRETKDYIRLSEKWIEEEERPAAFARGQRVRHPIFGEGTVEETDMERKAYLIRFDGMETPRNISFKAKLIGI